MVKDDWFRNREWNSAIAEQFEIKLQRARDKSQYLRIQANGLTNTYPKEALALLDRYFLLGENFDLAQAYVDQSQAYLSLNDFKAAIHALQLALKREQAFPNLRTSAWRHYVLLIATRRESTLYADALAVLDKNPSSSMIFPSDKFCWFGAFALICDALSQKDQAKEAARKALSFVEATHSGIRYHPDVGLVGKEYESIKNSLLHIAE